MNQEIGPADGAALQASSPERGAAPPAELVLSWGRYPRLTHRSVHRPSWDDQLAGILRPAPPGSLLPLGLGRSYGDSCLNGDRELIDCSRLNRILGFDESTGVVRCEGGVSLRDLIEVFLPKGWFLPVTP